MESVYPQLYFYCKQRGYDFRMVDLRRGVEDPVTDHHDSVELHLEMLKRCQETVGPNFFVSLSDFLTLSLSAIVKILNLMKKSIYLIMDTVVFLFLFPSFHCCISTAVHRSEA